MTTYDAHGNPSIDFASITPGMLVHVIFRYFDDALAPGTGGTLEHYTKVRAKTPTTLTTWEGWETPIETGWIDPSQGQLTYYQIAAAAPTEPTLGTILQSGVDQSVWERVGTDPAVSDWRQIGDATSRTWSWLQTNRTPLIALTQVPGTP